MQAVVEEPGTPPCRPNQQCKQRGTACAPAASQLSRTAAAGSGCPIVTAAPTSPRLLHTLNGQVLTTERFIDLLFECGLGDATTVVLLSDASSIVEVMAALRPEQVAKLELQDAEDERQEGTPRQWQRCLQPPPANGMEPSWYTVDTLKAKQAVEWECPLTTASLAFTVSTVYQEGSMPLAGGGSRHRATALASF
eukprot:gene8111-8305_t